LSQAFNRVMKAAVKKNYSVKDTKKDLSSQKATKERRSSLRYLVPLSVVMVTFLAFLPTLQNGFVNWDDLTNFIDNTGYRGLGWTQLRWMFTTFHLSLYRPVTWMTLGFDHVLWGMNPLGYHLTSLLFHCANALLFYFVALRLLRLGLPAIAGSEVTLRFAAGFAALFFSLHPLRVEAVAWASARNDVVSALFLLLSVLCYLEAAANAEALSRYARWLTAAVLFFAVSLLAKGIGMTLPFVLLVLDIYPLRRLKGRPRNWFSLKTRRIWWEKVPFLVLGIIAGIIAVRAKQEGQVVHNLEQYGLTVRITESFYGLAFYLWKTVLPIALSPLYERPDQPDPLHWIFWLSAVAVVAITVSLFVLRLRWPAGLATWVCYGVALAPVLGIVQFGPQVAADRYSYLACLGWALLVGAAIGRLCESWKRQSFNAVRWKLIQASAATSLFALSCLTWQQARLWHDSERLWRHALTVDPNSSYAYNNLAAEMKDQGNLDDAIHYYRKAVLIKPNFPLAYHNLGGVLFDRGEFDDAARNYRMALAIDPKSVKTYQKLGATLARQGQFDEAVTQYSKALQVNPNDAGVHNDLGNALAVTGAWKRAIDQYRKAAELDPMAREPYFNLGNLMARQGRLEEATVYFERALTIDPNYSQAHHNLGRVLASEEKLDQAVDHFRQAVRIQPNFMAARESLVLALEQQGRKEEARREYAEAIQMLRARDPRSHQ